MDWFICNMCLSPVYRGKKPFALTECGHIYCNPCLMRAEKQCPQCKTVGPASINLIDPTPSKVTFLFMPIENTLETLLKAWSFRNQQNNILLQRFLDLDKKYQKLKSQYQQMLQHYDHMKQKYSELQNEIKRMDYAKTQRNMMTPQTNSSGYHTMYGSSCGRDMITPRSEYTKMNPPSTTNEYNKAHSSYRNTKLFNNSDYGTDVKSFMYRSSRYN